VFNLSKIQIESNSQPKIIGLHETLDCVQSFKDTNRKQFTTDVTKRKTFGLLCSIFQRYKSKAIHNINSQYMSIFVTVFNLSKIQIESNSQPDSAAINTLFNCVQSFKDTNRKQFTTRHSHSGYFHRLCSIFQRYKSKAIHNHQKVCIPFDFTVFNLSKIQIESNSQQLLEVAIILPHCVQSFKDTNRKQFTT